VKSLILDSLLKNPTFNNTDYLNDTIQIEILSNGKANGIAMTKSTDKALTEYIAGLIKRLPEQWFPALAHPADVLDLMDFPNEENKIKVRTNSIVKIGL